MKKIINYILIGLLLVTAGCAKMDKPPVDYPPENNPPVTNPDIPAEPTDPIDPIDPIDPVDPEPTDYAMTITEPGSYTLTGEINGVIFIDAGEDSDVELIFDNVTIISKINSPIYCKSANELKIKLNADTVNAIYDNREPLTQESEDTTLGKGAIYAKTDLKFTGKGSLTISANYNNGIHSTDDIKFKNTSNKGSSIKIVAYNHAVKGNDSIEIESGKFEIISKCGSGFKTENSSISSKGNQKGSILISGGEFDVYSCEDAFEAAYNIEISNNPTFKIVTSKFSSYTLGSNSNDDSKDSNTMYLRTSLSNYNYSISFKLSDGSTTWVDGTYDSSVPGGRGSTYYYYSFKAPANAQSMKIYQFDKTVTTKTEENARTSTTNYVNLNTNYDTCILSVGYSLSISSWTNKNNNFGGPSGPGGMGGFGSSGNTNKVDYSAKGLKAENEIIIHGGEFDIKTYDDAIHANYGETLENNEIGKGQVTINGGTFTIYSTDDGIHADSYLTINGGTIDILSSYEGLEANIINICGGVVKVYSTDDGLNAANKANMSPQINISGGIVDITVYGNDIDGIDSNNTYTQTGGLVITKGGTGQMSTGLDTDGATKITGGSLIIFGRPEKTPQLGSGVVNYNLNGNYTIGTYEITNGETTVEVTTKYSYSVIYIYSSETNRYIITKK